MKKSPPLRLLILSLLCIGALLSSGSAPLADDGYWSRQLQKGKMNLPVDTVLQSRVTSCGEAVIAMAYNYAYPETQIDEQAVIDYAVAKGYYTEEQAPFTSPADMTLLADHYADTVSTGAVSDADEGLSLLIQKLTGGDPVMIDVFTLLGDPRSGAHFVVVTGIAIDPKNPDDIQIYYNDPMTGTNRSSPWLGSDGIWDAWQNNNDPGGSGWWMMISSP